MDSEKADFSVNGPRVKLIDGLYFAKFIILMDAEGHYVYNYECSYMKTGLIFSQLLFYKYNSKMKLRSYKVKMGDDTIKMILY